MFNSKLPWDLSEEIWMRTYWPKKTPKQVPKPYAECRKNTKLARVLWGDLLLLLSNAFMI